MSYDWSWDDAFRNIDSALEANPSLAIAYYHRAWFHFLFGRIEEAIADHKRAREVDPFNPLHTAFESLGEPRMITTSIGTSEKASCQVAGCRLQVAG